jgi:curli biogenesis system outer membrane secretion channel CsgG
VSDEFVKQLIFRGLDVIEREGLESLLREQHLATAKLFDPETIKELGRLSGVDTLITAPVTRYISEHKDTIYFQDKYGQVKSEVFLIGAEVGVNARMIDVETGLIVWASSYTYESFDMEGTISETVSTLLNSLKKVWPRIKKS